MVHISSLIQIFWLYEYTLFYFALLPIEAIFVTLILDQLMELRARNERLEILARLYEIYKRPVSLSVLAGHAHEPVRRGRDTHR